MSAAPVPDAAADPAAAAPGTPPPGLMPAYWLRARTELAAADDRLGAIIQGWGSAHLVSRGDAFVTLARSIVGQQISVKAAQAVWQRFERECRTVVPARVARMRLATLTRAGLSTRKAEYVRDLAAHFVSGEVDPLHWPALDDEAVIAQLVQVRGIGRWTAEMFLIFNLLRPNVFPLDDLGLLKAISIHYNEGRSVSRAEATEIGVRWQPWRTVATWYLWRSLDPVPVEY
jgi:DNA-3-methyladenine glycosylase II